MHNLQTDFLFAEPNELFGVARLWDIGGRFDSYNYSRSESEADVKAILSDWSMVGLDLKRAMEFINQDTKK